MRGLAGGTIERAPQVSSDLMGTSNGIISQE
jgi:hypothetical protein